MSSPLSVAVSGSDADPPEQSEIQAVPTAVSTPETEPAPTARSESSTPAERDGEKPVSAPAVSATRAQSPAPAETGPSVKSVIWSKIVENLVPGVLCGIVVGMFGFVLASNNIRINDTNDKIDKLEIRMNDKIDAKINVLEVKMDAKINALDSKINVLDSKVDDLDTKVDDLDTKVDEINLKLTALIAALNKTDDVDAAVSGIVVPADL